MLKVFYHFLFALVLLKAMASFDSLIIATIQVYYLEGLQLLKISKAIAFHLAM